MKARRFLLAAALTAAAAAAGACGPAGALDVIARRSVVSFGVLIDACEESVAFDESLNAWALSSPDGSARFIWKSDGGTGLCDAAIEFDAEPFFAAGLDPARLPSGMALLEDGDGAGRRLIAWGASPGPGAAGEASSALSSFEVLISGRRGMLSFHTAMDHFGLSIGNAGMFEWAKDLDVNGYNGSAQRLDAVFALNPAALEAAGLDPEKVDGWAYTRVEVMVDSRTALVWKLLKVIDLDL